MTLPVDNALYYLHHVSGNKYVHPKGGSDTPGNDNGLVFHEPNGRLALQFYFNTINGFRQLVHYGSGRFIHPSGGHAGNGVHLVTYDGCDGARTSVNMMVSEGKTFLISGSSTNPQYYVHPEGGSATPGDDTSLVYHSDFRPALAIELVPAEEYTVLSIKFEQSSINNLNQSTVAVEKTITNNTSAASTSKVVLAYSQSVSNTVTYSFTEKLGIKISNKVKSDFFVAGSTVTVEASFEFSATQTTATSTTSGVSFSSEEDVTVEPHTSVKVSLVTTKASGRVPFTAHVRSSRGQEMDINGVADCELFIKQNVTQDLV